MTQEIITEGSKFKKIQEKLKLENAKFKKLSKPEQRIAIAKDVIAQIKAKKFVAGHTYFQLGKNELNPPQTYEAVEKKLQLGECIAQVGCEVCGIGSLFASAVLKNDKLKFEDFYDVREQEVEYLGKWFSKKQLDLVEVYFEQDLEAGYGADYRDTHSWEDEIFPDHPIVSEPDDDRRLIMIMENIVSNDGKFDPRKGKHSDKNAVVF